MEIAEFKDILLKKYGDKISWTLPHPHTIIGQAMTDSRNMFAPGGATFFAIRSSHGNDGHDFIPELYEGGIRNFIVEYVPEFLSEKSDVNYIKVPETVKALAELGRKGKENTARMVAITGSRGKTSVKEILFQLLEPLTKISRSPRSYNSKIGVPLSLWQIAPQTQLSLIEAGISKAGEMEFLTDLIEPDTVIFTNIGEAHSEGFDSAKHKAEEKVKLAGAHATRRIIYPADDEMLSEALRPYMAEKGMTGWSLKDKSAPLYVEITDEDNRDNQKTIAYTWQGRKYDLSTEITYPYEIENTVTALAFMLTEGYTPELIKQRFASLHGISTRMTVSEGVGGCTIVLDSYTSDLTSLVPAIDFIRRRKAADQTLTLVLSDLLHETESMEETYRHIARLVKEGGISRFIGIGPQLCSHRELFPENSSFFKSTADFQSTLQPSDFSNEIILLKGAPEYGFNNVRKQLEARKHETVLHVNLDAIVRNYNYFRSLVPKSTGIIAMVKAFGYGVGSYEIAKTLQDCGAAYLAVAVQDEGIDLRRNGLVMPVMVMNPGSNNYKTLFEHHLQPVVYSMPMLSEILREAEKNGCLQYPIHIKLDTGMHRMGFTEEELPQLISHLQGATSLKVESVFSHLATADSLDMDEYTLRQLNLFERMSGRILSSIGYAIKRHVLNSAGIIRFPQYHYDMVRLGIGLYGANTLPTDIEKPLSTVATLETVIICIREIAAGEAVGYSRRGTANKQSRIATIPVGYADGIDRRLGNGHMKVMIKGKEAPTIGNICMDATMIDVTDIPCQEGDTVEIFGNNMPLQRLADTLGTIPYEILTSVSLRVKRNYFRE